jgi:hypothetical protein
MVDNNLQDSMSFHSNDYQWKEDCQIVAKNDSFYTFRKHPTIIRMMEAFPVRTGRWLFRRLKRNSYFQSLAGLFSTSDKVGAPRNLLNFTLQEKNIEMNPYTLRCVANILNLVELFSVDIFSPELSNNRSGIIVEIGAGYGGDCKIANDFSVEYHKVAIGKRWNIFDLPSSTSLIIRWLNEFGYEAQLNQDPGSLKDIFLIISNCAFSELSRNFQEWYFKEIITHARQGYFIENFGRKSSLFGGFTRAEFIDRLKKAGKNVYELDARTWLSNFDNDAKSGLIVFSEKEIVIPTKRLYVVERFEILFRRILQFRPFLLRIPLVRKYLNERG